MESMGNTVDAALKKEIKLQINQRLYDSGVISKEIYEAAKIKIIAE